MVDKGQEYMQEGAGNTELDNVTMFSAHTPH
jgi:hypothetical protein